MAQSVGRPAPADPIRSPLPGTGVAPQQQSLCTYPLTDEAGHSGSWLAAGEK